MEPGPTLRSLRLRSGLTQAEVAARAATSQATLSSYESSRKQPSVATFSRLMGAMGWRLAVARAERPVLQPSAAQLAQTAANLQEVLALAEALPVRHEPLLGFPRMTIRSS